MNDFQQQTLSHAQALLDKGAQAAPVWLTELREQGARRFARTGWPTRRTENWKYTPLASLGKKSFSLAQSAPALDAAAQLELDAYRIVFNDGVLDRAASSQLPPEVTLFGEANAEQAAIIESHLGRLADSEQHLFAAMSEALLAEGVLLHVPANTALNKPLYIVNQVADGSECLANTRLLVVLETGAEAEVIEHYLTASDASAGFVNAQTEVVIGDNARFKHYRLNLEGEAIHHVGGVFAELQRDANFDGFAIAKGAELMRIDYGLLHRGPGAHVELNGVYLPRNKQLVDYHTNVQHCVPHCTTNEVFRGIIGDRAKAVFNGRIHIHKDAQKTLAELSNKNLLTSNKAEVDTKPELEIYADDVRCAHGATVSQINDAALYYLQTRGVSKTQARVMLSFGFVNELIQQVANPAVLDYLVPELARQFGRDTDLLLLDGDSFE
ncbi:Fe-S cluster assembly protein SufD [uncultured Gilvimarinus sp.]|uniref:Fe-S cluster assembly protein SufD n=1 Tax=uncultured Gilvimarinus sp. TaxID=1689143 RepID=UPI0030EF99C7|tara:strand:- start:843 stop:2162 length:1320 start_codon:yes stop_codon:yes gene_type:complete